MSETPETDKIHKPITMSDIRLAAGEGKFTTSQMLDACNAVIRQRKTDAFIEILKRTEKVLSEKDDRNRWRSVAEQLEERLRPHVEGRGCEQSERNDSYLEIDIAALAAFDSLRKEKTGIREEPHAPAR